MEKLTRLYDIEFDENYNNYHNIIIDIFDNNNLNYDLTDNKILNIIGLCYQYKIKNYDEMKKYYLMAIELKNEKSMNNLANYYYDQKNYDEMKKYYLMSIELNNSTAMNNFGYYYQTIEKNYDEMKKYYLMSIELNNARSMYNLGNYYRDVEKNYDEMKKYYLMAIKLNNAVSMCNLCDYYKSYLQHHLLRQINSTIAIDRIKQLEKNNFLGVKIFEELTKYCFNPQRLLRLCNIYEIRFNEYMDII